MGILRMERTGVVKTAANGPNQCKNSGHDTFGYLIKVSCHEDNKDERGFIVDNMEIQGLVESVFSSEIAKESCETLVCHVGHTTEAKAKEHGVQVLDVFVRIWPINGSTPVDVNNVASFEYSLTGNF